MKTKDEIISELFNYLDLPIMDGFFTKEEAEHIYALEQEYYIQEHQQKDDAKDDAE